MKTQKFVSILLGLMLVAMLLGACTPPAQAPASGDQGQEAAQTGDKPYIAIISKGFQHQFWQAVRQGAENAAKDYNVDITFEGPENESMVDKQVEMVQTALDKTGCPVPGCARQQGAGPAVGKGSV